MKKSIYFILSFLFCLNLTAQEKLDYQKPPKEILDLVDAPLAPSVLIDKKGEHMLLVYSDPYKSIAELSEEELRLGGLRINPKTNIGSRTRYYINFKTKKALENEIKQVKGLPENPRISNINWSPDQKMVAFTHTTDSGVEAWVLDMKSATARKLMSDQINANMGNPLQWSKDNKSLFVNVIPEDRKALINTKEAIPDGPVISVSEGEKAQNRTYQDLLSNPNDEFNFEQLAKSKIVTLDLQGNTKDFLPSAMYSDISISPDGKYVMVTKIKKPFSYLVPYYRFPSETTVYTKSGEKVNTVMDVPLQEVLPQGFMSVRTGRRSMSWRNDKPSTLIYAKALDEGDPAKEVEFRDEVFQLEAPFTGEGTSMLKTINRYSYIQWGTENLAIAHDYWWNTRNTKSYIFNPSKKNDKATVLFDRNYQDNYNDPGSFVSTRNEFNEYILELNGNKAYLMGDGYTPEGQFPFVDEIDLSTQKKQRLYVSAYTDKLENLYSSIDMKKGTILVRIESKSDYPNYYIRNIRKEGELKQITNFENPFKSMQNVHKEVISYKREDGLSLDGTLYLPVDYDMEAKEKKPMILWAYPREYKDKSSAGQNTSNPNEFIYPYYGSPVYWVTQGYVVLDNAAFPIVGEGEEEPNDTFRKQLVDNAKAAIDAVNEMGYIDPGRVAVGGHSYGAFMVANLLSHSDLFAAGIARSGAYNRTLTPFGFQSEERTYWESPETYYTMSPFMHADKMKTPLLLIHGQADNNSGTYPLQSERYFNALKGLGATARLVMLPKESHGYSAKESILHMLWEQHQWLEKYVKNKEENVQTGSAN